MEQKKIPSSMSFFLDKVKDHPVRILCVKNWRKSRTTSTRTIWHTNIHTTQGRSKIRIIGGASANGPSKFWGGPDGGPVLIFRNIGGAGALPAPPAPTPLGCTSSYQLSKPYSVIWLVRLAGACTALPL